MNILHTSICRTNLLNPFNLVSEHFSSPYSIYMASLSESSTTFVIPNITQLVSVKLNDINYINWTTKFTPDLRSHDLSSIVDDSNPCASQFIVDDTGKTTSNLNPAYLMVKKWLIYPYMDKCHIIWESYVHYLWTKFFSPSMDHLG